MSDIAGASRPSCDSVSERGNLRLRRESPRSSLHITGKRVNTFVGLKLAITSATAEVFGRLFPRVRVMFSDVEGVPLAGEDLSTVSRSIGVDAMVGGSRGAAATWESRALLLCQMMIAKIPRC